MEHRLSLRDDNGRFLPGTSPGPGRPRNSRPRLVTALREALDEDETLSRLRAVAIRKLEEGDPSFWKLLLDRVWPAKMDVEVGASGRTIELRWQGEDEADRDVIDVEPLNEISESSA